MPDDDSRDEAAADAGKTADSEGATARRGTAHRREPGDRHVELETLDPVSLDEALSIVGEETRARILLELGAARTTDPGASNALGFSALMDRVGVADSGLFNYHLEKLVGTFVARREAGYALRLPGLRLHRAIVAGTLTDRRTVEPFPVGDCPDCDGDLSAGYHPDHLLTVECTDCATLFDAIHFPTRGLDERSREAVLDAAYQRRHHEVAAMRRGVCPGCAGRVRRSLEPEASITYGSGSVSEMAGLETYAVLACEACTASLVGHPTNVALTAPAVVGFFADHGRDPALARWWDDPVATARERVEVVADDPPAVAVPFAIDGDRLRVVLDDDLRVVESVHHSTDADAAGS